jgi:ABC-2 type transport system ATP-binding protein
MNVLEARNLTKKFKNFVAVDDISFVLKEGEILGLLGRNGAGKTTTIQMLLGVLTPTSGDVFYFGKNLKDNREEILERVNFASPYTNLPLDLTVKENLTVISYLYKIKNRKKRIDKIVEIFQLEEIFKQQVKEISAGQQTKVNLAKAFLNFPSVLLLDEPTASLDPEVAEYIRGVLIDECQEFNVSMIFTSHNMAEVEEVCDRIIFIDEGRIVAEGEPSSLASSINISHLRLRIENKFQEIVPLCAAARFPCRPENPYITVDLSEKDIPIFLKELMDRGINYNEISIEKPTLEDYFLQVTKKYERA